ncbi:tyrosine-type recombinase/integrase, partial [Gemmiger sp.]|uniref:tyrosine-type recombinase/integrase n=1 Tax=Gemmiger sp. TaxID=2049027 RepID=UPI00307BD715
PRWFATMQETTSAGNCRNIASRWKIWILPLIGNKRITSLTEQDVQEVVNKAYAAGKSKKTLKSLCADMRAFFKYCRLCKLSTFNPEALRIPAGARYKGKQVLQPADLVKLFNIDTTTYNRRTVPDEYINAYRFQVLTGLRPGEVIGLTWADIHGDTVNICRSVNIKGEQTRGKNENAVRSFTVSALARRVLDAQQAETDSTGSVFQITNEPHYYRRWKVYCAVNGLTPCSLYELRHTFVSVVKTLPAGEVKGLVGHSEDMDTFGVYAHTLAGDAENTARAVNGVFLRVLKNA